MTFRSCGNIFLQGRFLNQISDPGVKLHNIGDVELEDLVGAKGLTKGTLWSVQAIYTNADSKVGLIQRNIKSVVSQILIF